MPTGEKTRCNRRTFLKALSALWGGVLLACGRAGQAPISPAAPAASPPSAQSPPTSDIQSLAAAAPPAPSGPRARTITANDFIPEQTNFIDTLVVSVNYSERHDQPFDLPPFWERIFGADDPLRQLNAFYKRIFYGQLQLRPVEVGATGIIEVELPGGPGDYSFGWLVGMDTEEIAGVDPEEAQRLILEVMGRVVEQHPEVDYQDKFILIVLNARGAEYGRGAAGALPTGGGDPVYDMFVGRQGTGDRERFSNPEYFRLVGQDRVLGLVRKSGYVYDDYFRDRGDEAPNDQFILGIGLFGRDAPLSCAVHDILHGLRRKAPTANPPEGRNRAVNCLYNLLLQSQWMVGDETHGHFDRSVDVSPYIGWWDPMGDHLHPDPAAGRDFFCSHPHGMNAFTRLRMGMIPDRCLAVVEADEATVRLAALSRPELPSAGAPAEALAVRVPLMPGNPNVAHIYLLLEYRSRAGETPHPDNFSIEPDFAAGDKVWDPGHNRADPAASRYLNPPTTFVSKEGVLVYLVNEKMPELPTIEYSAGEWYKFVLVLLNPAGNAQRDDLTQAALAAGERIEVDFRTLYAHAGVPIRITVSVASLTGDEAEVHIRRESVGRAWEPVTGTPKRPQGEDLDSWQGKRIFVEGCTVNGFRERIPQTARDCVERIVPPLGHRQGRTAAGRRAQSA
jgi:hypothetical protein